MNGDIILKLLISVIPQIKELFAAMGYSYSLKDFYLSIKIKIEKVKRPSV